MSTAAFLIKLAAELLVDLVRGKLEPRPARRDGASIRDVERMAEDVRGAGRPRTPSTSR